MAHRDLEQSLDANELASLLSSGTGWERPGHALTTTNKLEGFDAVVTLVNEIAKAAIARA